MKRFLFAFSFVFLFLLSPLQVFAVIPRSDVTFVTDGARLLSKDTTSYIVEASRILYQLELIDYNVVTISDLGDAEMEEYADAIFEEYPLGDNGVLILVARGNGLLRVQVGSELGEFIDEDIIDEYIDRYFTPYIEAGDWDTGIKNGYNSFYKLICDHYNLDTSNIVLLEEVDFKTKYSEYFVIGLSILATIFAVILLEMYRNIFIRRRYHDTVLDYLLVAFIMILNVALLVFCYLLKPMSFLIVLFVEGISLYSFYHNNFDLFTLKHFKIDSKLIDEKKVKKIREEENKNNVDNDTIEDNKMSLIKRLKEENRKLKEENQKRKEERFKKKEEKKKKKKIVYSDELIKQQILNDQKIKEFILKEREKEKKQNKEKKILERNIKDNRY